MIHVLALFLISTLAGCASCSSDLKENGKENGKEEKPDTEEVRPESFASDDEMLDYIQKVHLNYMWDGAEPTSGLARERIHLDGDYPEKDQNVVTTGGSGFGIAGLLVGIERGFIPREEGVKRLTKIADYLKRADRFHGVWPHWLYGPTGKVKPFGQKDNGGDLVESCFLMQSLLCVRQYFRDGNEQEKALVEKIDQLWKEMEFSWYQNGKDVIYWHWSPEYNWEMNFPLEGYNEALIVYVRNLSDRYANYWNVVRNHALSNYRYCVENPKQYKGYGEDCWGLTASYSTKGYAAHCPGDNDHGVITPTAALSSFPYTPEESMRALKYFYSKGDWIWGKYGFYDAFSEGSDWTVPRYLAIDQCTIAPMIENYRSGLLWKLFMSCPEVQEGLQKLGFKA